MPSNPLGTPQNNLKPPLSIIRNLRARMRVTRAIGLAPRNLNHTPLTGRQGSQL